MANEVFKGLFGFSPDELTQQRDAANQARAFQMAQLDPLQQASFQGFNAASGIRDSVKDIGRSLFNIEDPQMRDSTVLDGAFQELVSSGGNPMSTQGIDFIISKAQQGKVSPQALERLLVAKNQVAQEEAATGLKAAQTSKATAEATRVQEEAAREQQMRDELASLPADATPEQRYAVVAKYASPDKQLAGIDYQARLKAERESRIEQAKLQHELKMEELRARNAGTAELARERQSFMLQIEQIRQDGKKEARDEKAAEKKATDQEKRQQMAPAFDSALATLDRIDNHPGKKAGVGFGGTQLSMVPGTNAAGFRAQLDTFKAQTFLPMVASLKGMGALSDAEGKKLTDAVGALSPDMPLKEFNAQIGIIRKDLQDARDRAMGKKPSSPESSVSSEKAFEAYYNSLPAGADYIGPDGKRRVKGNK